MSYFAPFSHPPDLAGISRVIRRPCGIERQRTDVHWRSLTFTDVRWGSGFLLLRVARPVLWLPVFLAPLAQLAEQVTLNHWVVGSIPTRCKPSSRANPEAIEQL